MILLQKITRRAYFSLALGILLLSGIKGFSQQADSIVVKIAPQYDRVGKFHRFLFGESYRKLWAAPVKLRILSLQTEKGGLEILQKGGGMQTRSLRLQDPDGKEWVLRTIQKYPERGLPENLRETVARDILQDQVSSVHPFASLTVPPLALALGIPHASPEIVYVADDPGLGIWRKEFAHSVYLFEEREPINLNNTENTARVQNQLMKNNKNVADQKIVLRARLLDMLLGDWDRHEDQWRWQKRGENGEISYAPVPRDRDHVYFKTSGLFPWIVSHQWLKSKFQDYDDKIRDIEGWNYNARYFDRFFLNGLSEEDWREQVRIVRNSITDQLIFQSLKRMPDTIHALSGSEIARKMISRRNDLDRLALTYYRFLAESVEIPASDKSEHFEITYRNSGEIEIEICDLKPNGIADRKLYHRTFYPSTTKEIRLYGLDAKNVFSVRGSGSSPIRLRMIGGPAADSFYVDRGLRIKRRTYLHDRHAGNLLPSGNQAKIRLSADTMIHEYNKLGFKYNRSGPLVLASYAADQGILLRLGLLVEKQGFQKSPYAVRHQLWGNYSASRTSFMISYRGDFKKAVGNTDLSVDFISKGPNYVGNFFGIGNETIFEDQGAQEIAYYRNRFDHTNAEVRLNQHWLNGILVSAGLGAEYYTSSSSSNRSRFFNQYNALHPGEGIFDERFFVGLVAGISHDTRLGKLLPWGGTYWTTQVKAMRQLNGDQVNFGRITSELNFYVSLARDTSLVLTNKIGGGTILGDAAFFQQMQLGGSQNLRGFHTNRFTGKSMLFHNLELRTKLFDFTSYIAPGTVGVIGFNDVGRVWTPGEQSTTWHHSYGGGMYLIPAELIFIQGILAHSKEGTQPYLSIGVNF